MAASAVDRLGREEQILEKLTDNEINELVYNLGYLYIIESDDPDVPNDIYIPTDINKYQVRWLTLNNRRFDSWQLLIIAFSLK